MKQSWHPDIDGLRGLAVILVVCYHVGLPGFSGGFVGVDVFFVISGFLITRQLLTMRDTTPVALLKDFYARRARRILPALGLFLAGTLAIGKVLLLPSGEQQDLAKSAVAATAFASNIFYWKAVGSYFAGPTELQPLLHTWSLAVEEQFYLFWPFLLLALWMIERRLSSLRRSWVVPSGIFVVSLLSFTVSVWWTWTAPTAAFYLTPSRVWEIGAGALLASAGWLRLEGRHGRVGTWAGLLAILFANWGYTGQTTFPGIAALVPVIAAGLVIASSSVSQEVQRGGVGSLLRSRPLAVCGSVSYSWYLWHWPLLAIARATTLGSRDVLRDTLLAGVAFVIAYASTKYIELPIRSRRIKLLNEPGVALAAMTASLVIALSGSVLLYVEARSFYRSTLAPQSMSCLSDAGAAFRAESRGQANDLSACVLSSGRRGPLYLIGDSHANHWSPAISEWAIGSDVRAYERSFPGCPVLLLGFPNTLPSQRLTRFSRECLAFSERSVAELRGRARNGAVAVVGVHWSYLADSGDVQALIRGLDIALDSLDGMGVRALVIGPTPLLDESAPECVARRSDEYCRLTRARFNTEEGGILAALTAVVAKHPADGIFDPTPTFCDDRWCYPTRSGTLLFRDRSHLSRAGAEAARARLGPYLDWLMTKEIGSTSRVLSAATSAAETSAMQ